MINGINTSSMNTLYGLMSQSRMSKYQIPQSEGTGSGGNIDYDQLRKIMDWHSAVNSLTRTSHDLYKSSFALKKLNQLSSGTSTSASAISSNNNVSVKALEGAVNGSHLFNVTDISTDVNGNSIYTYEYNGNSYTSNTNIVIHDNVEYTINGLTTSTSATSTSSDPSVTVNTTDTTINTSFNVIVKDITSLPYQNDFSNTSLSDFTINSGTWSVVNGELVQSSTSGDLLLNGSESYSENRTVSTDFRVDEGSGSVGVVLSNDWADGTGGYLNATVDLEYDVLSFYYKDFATGQEFKKEVFYDFQSGVDYNLEVTSDEFGNLNAVVKDSTGNSLVSNTTTDVELTGKSLDTSGQTGLFTSNNKTAFDNFNVSDSSGSIYTYEIDGVEYTSDTNVVTHNGVELTLNGLTPTTTTEYTSSSETNVVTANALDGAVTADYAVTVTTFDTINNVYAYTIDGVEYTSNTNVVVHNNVEFTLNGLSNTYMNVSSSDPSVTAVATSFDAEGTHTFTVESATPADYGSYLVNSDKFTVMPLYNGEKFTITTESGKSFTVANTTGAEISDSREIAMLIEQTAANNGVDLTVTANSNFSTFESWFEFQSNSEGKLTFTDLNGSFVSRIGISDNSQTELSSSSSSSSSYTYTYDGIQYTSNSNVVVHDNIEYTINGVSGNTSTITVDKGYFYSDVSVFVDTTYDPVTISSTIETVSDPATISVTENTEETTSGTGYNEIVDFFASYNNLTMLLMNSEYIDNDLLKQTSNYMNSINSSLSSIGISKDSNGLYQINQDKLNSSLQNDFETVDSLFENSTKSIMNYFKTLTTDISNDPYSYAIEPPYEGSDMYNVYSKYY